MGKGGKLTLEEYTDFFNNVDDRVHFSLVKLYQIVSMHGFVRPRDRQKTEVLDAVKALDLMSPTRSTLEERISADAPLTVAEVRADVEAIGWQGCPIVSLLTAGDVGGDGGRSAASAVCSPSSSASNAGKGCFRGGGGVTAPTKKRKRSNFKKSDCVLDDPQFLPLDYGHW